MKQIIIVLLLALSVFTATVFVTEGFISRRAVQNADYVNNMVLDAFCKDFNSELERVQDAAINFLSSNFSAIQEEGDSLPDFYNRKNRTKHLINWLADDMRDFLAVNPSILSVALFVDDSVSLANEQYGMHKNYVMYMLQDSTKLTSLGNYDFMNAKSYNKVKSTRDYLWTLPNPTSPIRGKALVLYIPITCEDGGFFGTFAVNASVTSLRDMARAHLPYGHSNSSMIIYDTDGQVVMASPVKYEQYGTISELVKHAGDLDISELHLDDKEPFSIYHGDKYLFYTKPIPAADWKVHMAVMDSLVYQDVNHVRRIVIATSAIGMLMMLLCCLVIFFQIRSRMKRQAAAEEELKMAAKVQQSMLKSSTYSTDGAALNAFMRPAREAGGDLYDYLEKDGKLLFCIGDVSGKGVSAALFMAEVVSLFRNSSPFYNGPEEIVTRINDVLSVNNPDMTFCTFFLGVLDRGNNRLTFCNAGHNHPVVVPSAASGKKPYMLACKPNMAMGMMEGYKYQSETMEFEEGDTLLLYTDGVTEAMNARHEEFGEKRLLEVSEQAGIQTVLCSVEKFVDGYEQTDDITMMTVRLC